MRIVAVSNQKGGTAKTTTAVNLAACLVNLNQRVLLIDLDAQGNASSWMLGAGEHTETDLSTVWTDHATLADQIVTTDWGVDLVPSSPSLMAVEKNANDYGVLRTAVSALKKRYQWVLIDCSPSLGLLTLSAFMAATKLIVPVEAHVLALEGLATLTQTMDVIRNRQRSRIELGAIIPCRVSRTRLAREVVEQLRAEFGKLVTSVVIRENIKLAEAPSWHQPITQYAPDSNGAADYQAVAGELLRKLR